MKIGPSFPLAASLLALMTGCGTSPEQPTPSETAAPVETEAPDARADADVAPQPLATQEPPPPATPATPAAATLVPESEKGEKGARNVLLTWASALENHQFGKAWEQFGHGVPPTGASRESFAKWWDRYRTITVAAPGGEMDAGAGSLYYTAPVTITGVTRDGKPYRLKGDVILRRVNDVDGATIEQLRWHIESADLKNA